MFIEAFMYSSQKVKTTQVSGTKDWTIKLCMYSGKLCSQKEG